MYVQNTEKQGTHEGEIMSNHMIVMGGGMYVTSIIVYINDTWINTRELGSYNTVDSCDHSKTKLLKKDWIW